MAEVVEEVEVVVEVVEREREGMCLLLPRPLLQE